MDFRLPNFDEAKILKIQINFWDRKSAIKCRVLAELFFPHAINAMTFASLRLFTCLVYVSTYCVAIAHLRQNKPFPSLYLGHAQKKGGRWTKILSIVLKCVQNGWNYLSNERFCIKFDRFLAEILQSEHHETLAVESILKCTVFSKLKTERNFNRQV